MTNALLDSIAPDVDFNAPEAVPAPEATPVVSHETTPEPVQTSEPEKTEQPAPRESKMVPIQALDEARHKERAARAEAQRLEKEAAERFAKLESRLEKLINPPPPIPDYNENPAEHLKVQQELIRQEMEKRFEEQDKASASQKEVVERQQVEQQVYSSVVAAEQEFVKSAPDYMQAVDYLRKVTESNLIEMGVDDPGMRAEIIHRQNMDMAAAALSQGKNPAEIAYKVAKNYGFVVKGSGDKQIAQIQKGMESSSLGSGGKSDSPLNLKAIEQMSDDEFDALLDDKQWKKVIGGR